MKCLSVARDLFLSLILVSVCLGWSTNHHRSRNACSSEASLDDVAINAGSRSAKDAEGYGDGSSRRHFLSFGTICSLTLASTGSPAIAMNPKSRTKGYSVQKTDAEWKSTLSITQYDILRLGATERPYSSILEGEKREGTFVCAGCGTKLFASDQKFTSGTGWPSFARALPGVEVENVSPVAANLVGAELRCGTCGGHLGDVFNDGFLFPGTPAFTSGKRYCIDGAALVFEPANGDPPVRGDLSPPQKQEPDWLSPPKITPREAV